MPKRLPKRLPKLFQDLATLEAETAEFELRDPAESDGDIKPWLGALPRDGTRFVVFAQDESDQDSIAAEQARRAKLAEWVKQKIGKQKIGKQKLRRPEAVQKEAAAAHPGLAAWLEANNAHE